MIIGSPAHSRSTSLGQNNRSRRAGVAEEWYTPRSSGMNRGVSAHTRLNNTTSSFLNPNDLMLTPRGKNYQSLQKPRFGSYGSPQELKYGSTTSQQNSSRNQQYHSTHLSGAMTTFHLNNKFITNQHQNRITTNCGYDQRILTGHERVISVNQHVEEERKVGERFIEHSVKVPKRVIREDVIEKVVVIPETITREEYIDEVQIIQEKIIEVARPVINETIVEVPEYIYHDKIVEVPEIMLQENIRHVPKIEYQERIHEVTKYINQEKIVEVPEIEYREFIVEKVVEVPEIVEQVITRHVPVPQYVDKPIPQHIDVEEFYDVERNFPIPVEAITTFEYRLPLFKSRVNRIQYQIYVPRFIEVPIAEEMLSGSLIAELRQNCSQVGLLAEMSQAVSLCEVENLATMVRGTDIDNLHISTPVLQKTLTDAWNNKTIHVDSTKYSKRGRPIATKKNKSSRVRDASD